MKEAVKLLQSLIKVRTVNKDETKAARIIKEFLTKQGIKSRIIESSKNRGNLLVTIKGTDKKAPTILLLGHLDVVEANSKQWTNKPFAGKLINNYVWGRGAMDCKGVVVAELMGLTELLREGYKPRGTIKLLFTAGEETGGEAGVGYLMKKHYDKIKADVVINEGGGLNIGGSNYLIQYAEKGNNLIKLIIKGQSTHGSTPRLGDNSLVKASKVIMKLSKHEPKQTVNKYVKETINHLSIKNLTKLLLRNKQLLKQALKHKEELASLLLPSMSNTLTPTNIKTNNSPNVIPGETELILDTRLLPNQSLKEFIKELKKVIGKELMKDVEIKPLMTNEGNESPINTTHYERVRRAMSEVEPGTNLVPFMTGYCTDSKYFRQKGITCYGFTPFKGTKELTVNEALKTIHGPNERISINDLELSIKFFKELLEQY